METRYETIVVTRSDLDDEAKKNVITKIETLIKKSKGKVHVSQDWGKQKLAFEVKKQPKGVYHFLGFEVDGSFITTLERSLKLEEAIILYQTHRVFGEFDTTLTQPERINRMGPPMMRRPRGPEGDGPEGFEPPAKFDNDSDDEV